MHQSHFTKKAIQKIKYSIRALIPPQIRLANYYALHSFWGDNSSSLLAGRRIFDIGAGNGWLVGKLLATHGQIVSLDGDPIQLQSNKNGLSIVCDVHHPPIKTESGDVFLFSSVLQVVPDPIRLLQKYVDLAKDGCLVIFIVPTGYPSIKNKLNNNKLSETKMFDYEEFVKRINDHYNCVGPGVIDEETLNRINSLEQLKLLHKKPAIKRIASIVFEHELYIAIKWGLSVPSIFTLAFHYFIGLFDSVDEDKDRVCEYMYIYQIMKTNKIGDLA